MTHDLKKGVGRKNSQGTTVWRYMDLGKGLPSTGQESDRRQINTTWEGFQDRGTESNQISP